MAMPTVLRREFALKILLSEGTLAAQTIDPVRRALVYARAADIAALCR
jgi:hypothetical protein